MITATLTSKGQITIPKEIRDKFNLKAGQRIEFRVTNDGQIILRPRTWDVMSLKGILKAKPGQHLTIEQMNEVIADGWAGVRRDYDKVFGKAKAAKNKA
jgi:AbrB family looped-hinge helix DNA binding protein